MLGRLGTSLPNFLQAVSPQGLRRKMIENNNRLGMFIAYFDIQFVNGKWYAWYYFDALQDEMKTKPDEKVD